MTRRGAVGPPDRSRAEPVRRAARQVRDGCALQAEAALVRRAARQVGAAGGLVCQAAATSVTG